MAKKIKIRKVSAWTMGITVVLAIMFAIISYKSEKEFRTLRMTTEQYIACEKAAKQLQKWFCLSDRAGSPVCDHPGKQVYGSVFCRNE